MQLVPTGRPRPYSGACRTIPPDTRPRRPDASTDRAACDSRAAADRTATLAGRQRQSCALAGRTTVPAAQQRRLHRNARHTAAPARGGTSWSAAPIGRGNTSGQVFHLAPSFEDRTRGHSLKCVGFNWVPRVDRPFRNLLSAVIRPFFSGLLRVSPINPTHII